MARLVRQAASNESIIRFSNSLIRPLRARDYETQTFAIYDYLTRVFSFVPNPAGIQLLRSGADMVRSISSGNGVQGSCADAAILAASIAQANGIPARFRAVAFDREGSEFTHVITDLYTGNAEGEWLAIDITSPTNPFPARDVTGTIRFFL